MNKIFKISVLSLALLGIALLSFSVISPNKSIPTWNISSVFSKDYPDHLTDKAMVILDQNNQEISRAARNVSTGDEIYKPDGKSYKVVRVEGEKAYAKYLGRDKELVAWQEFFNNYEVPVTSKTEKDNVGIYHTHTDESYVPTDGKAAIPFKGGIYQVGSALVNSLKSNDTNVIWDKTPHDPHDNNAYIRSRRTATNLMKNNPVAIFDVHRDGIPDPDYYKKQVSGQTVAQLRLVIGRQNPKVSSNTDFAKRLMAYANKVHPNIVKEIYMGKGNYNQDLMSTALLVEAGTHTNSKVEAEKGISMLADAVPVVLGVNKPAKPEPTGATGSWKALGWILAITILGAGAFLIIGSGSLKNAGTRLRKFGGNEMANYFGPPYMLKKPVHKKIVTEDKKELTKDKDKTDALDLEVLKNAHDDISKD
ncbi:stage II sporulation protein P [Desulfofarcimen acetoxidans DSM 771]|uniref:Stage II sporulation protein P n=1 Tax=Desulfofarcimen acetoxidans (strain ATCC 49208 / DSM 771 / KCTC 5769 / VKM B-1644 / 5575) TaxID=485916 RepID=C8VZ23_DESAS|nr:stage II sporulation protein P [Desulfofarcimen acetoxidans]ACV62933.1 stage II sporulation protein P [Desulfofarcimen acetoxidans DSM 771]